jgi:uncharacterized protein YgiM (DUF1202 family)
MFKILTVILSSTIFISCSTAQKPESVYYTIPTISYLRDGPSYDSQVVGELYSADQVTPLNKNDGWWRVQSSRDEKIGWTQRDLLSEAQIIVKNYYITENGVPLRDAPNEDLMSRNLLSLGDQVQKVDQKGGWWRVLVEKDKAIGWVPAAMASETQPVPPGSVGPSNNASEQGEKGASLTKPDTKPNYYFVTTENLKMFIIPLISSQVVKVLILNSKVEEIAHPNSEWVKIRYLDTGAEGWAQARYLKDSPVTKKSQIVTPGKKSRKKTQSHKSLNKETSKSKKLEPEGM